MSKTIFMIHGMWGTPWYWEYYRNYFKEKGYQCITPTLRYHDMNPGDLPDPRLGTTSLLDYAADLEREIGQLDEKPVIMGHSMGGLLAQMLGSRGLARSLVLLCPASPAGIMALRFSVMKSFWSAFTTWGFWKKPMRPTFDEVVYSTLHLMPPAEQKEIYAQLVYESGRAASEIGLWLLDPKGASRVDEKNVTCPVLVISGTEDRIVPSTVVRKVAKKYEMVSTYREFEHHAHWVVGEPGWQEITDYIYQWLNKSSGG